MSRRTLAEHVQAAHLDDVGDDYADLETAARCELAHLWSDLESARQHAISRVWSMQCDWISQRIAGLSRLVGVTPWQEVDLDLLADGVYQLVLDAAGLAYEPPDMAQVSELRRRVSGARP